MYNIQSYDQMLKSGGYGKTADQVVDDLRKAMMTNTGEAMANGNGPLMLENLDGVMTEVLITEQHFKLYNLLNKVPSSNPYYEYNVHKGFGSRRSGGAGFAQGGAPKGGISSFKREGIYNKFLGELGGVTQQAMMTGQNGGAFEDPTVRENRDRTVALLEKVERELFFGQEAVLDENGNDVNFDGLLTQLAKDYPQNVIDMQGAPLGYDQLDEAALDLITTGKQPTMNGYINLMSAHVADGLNRQFGARGVVRYNKDGAQGTEYTPGQKVPGYDTNYGHIKFDFSILLEEVEGSKPLYDGALANTPATPAITTQPLVADEATGTHAVGTYYYSVSAFNDTGESLPVITQAAAVTDATSKVTIVVTRVTGATGYRIYRGIEADGSDAIWIAKVAQPSSGNLTFVDKGEWKTVGSDGKAANGLALLVKPDPKDICIAQMTPLIKFPQPWAGTTLPFLLMIYMVSVIKAPQRVKIYKNCGTYSA